MLVSMNIAMEVAREDSGKARCRHNELAQLPVLNTSKRLLKMCLLQETFDSVLFGS